MRDCQLREIFSPSKQTAPISMIVSLRGSKPVVSISREMMGYIRRIIPEGYFAEEICDSEFK
jgi:hypothetical protein